MHYEVLLGKGKSLRTGSEKCIVQVRLGGTVVQLWRLGSGIV